MPRVRPRLALGLVLVTVALLGLPAAAPAITATSSSGNVTAAEYENPGDNGNDSDVSGGETGEGGGTVGVARGGVRTATAEAGGLPRTGFLLIPVVAAGLLLLGAGLGARRAAGERRDG